MKSTTAIVLLAIIVVVHSLDYVVLQDGQYLNHKLAPVSRMKRDIAMNEDAKIHWKRENTDEETKKDTNTGKETKQEDKTLRMIREIFDTADFKEGKNKTSPRSIRHADDKQTKETKTGDKKQEKQAPKSLRAIRDAEEKKKTTEAKKPADEKKEAEGGAAKPRVTRDDAKPENKKEPTEKKEDAKKTRRDIVEEEKKKEGKKEEEKKERKSRNATGLGDDGRDPTAKEEKKTLDDSHGKDHGKDHQ